MYKFQQNVQLIFKHKILNSGTYKTFISNM